MKSLNVTDVLRGISDQRSLNLFKTIALLSSETSDTNRDRKTELSIEEMKLSRKQYYSRLSRLLVIGVIAKRNNRNYALTSLGKVVYEYLKVIENALNNDYWKLKAIDSLESSKDLPENERKRLIDSLLENEKVKQVLIKDF
jgi:predicted transcriptional regulator